MLSGKIAKTNEKGFGFIKQDSGKDLFFHVTGMINKSEFDELQEGDPVTYNIDNGQADGRPRAVDVKRA